MPGPSIFLASGRGFLLSLVVTGIVGELAYSLVVKRQHDEWLVYWMIWFLVAVFLASLWLAVQFGMKQQE